MTEIMYTTTYCNERAIVEQHKYNDGSTALIIKALYDGDHLSTATVCMAGSGEKPADGNVFIKDWSENTGTLKCLIDQKVIGEPVRTVQAGFSKAYECKLLV